MRWDHYRNGWGMQHDGGFAWLVFGILMVLLAVLASALVVLLMRHPGPVGAQRNPLQAPESEALRILERRFASGEIDEEEFRKRRAALAEGP
jgi:putative membrane protein